MKVFFMRIIFAVMVAVVAGGSPCFAQSLNDTVQAYLAANGKTGGPLVEYQLGDDGSGPQIMKWDETKLGPRPTADQLQAVAAVATTQAQDRIKESAVNLMPAVAFAVALDHENRLRKLEGKAAITAAQFRAAIKAALP